jgi:hypothetical protein
VADIPLISTTLGSGTNAPVAAANTINALVGSVNTLIDTTIPGINASVAANAGSITALNSSVTSLNNSVGVLNTANNWAALPAASLPLTGAELTRLVQGGLNVRATVAAMNPNAVTRFIDFGAYVGWDPTGITDQSTILNQAVSDAITAGVQLRIPGGIYLLNSPVNLSPLPQDGIDMVGPSPVAGGAASVPGFGGFNPKRHGVKVYFMCSFTDRPAFYMNNARQFHLANFAIAGMNNPAQFQEMNDIKTNYITGGCRDSQYSPYCGLAIDAFNCAVPPDGGYPGMTASYFGSTQNGSSNGLVENVTISGFVVGIGHCLSGVGSQTDTTTYFRCNVLLCDTCIAVGQPQSKVCAVILGNYGQSRQAFDGVNYGAGTGLPIPVWGVNFTYLHRFFNYQSTVGPMFIHDCYAESCRSFGNYGIGGSTTRGHCTISNMQFTLHAAAALPLPIIFETFGSASIRDINFGADVFQVPSWGIANNLATPIEIDTCTFVNSVSGVPALVGLTSAGSGVTFQNCISNVNGTYQPLADISSADVSTFTAANRFAGTVHSTYYANGVGETFYQSPNITGSVAAAATGTAFTNRAITFTTTLALGAVSGTLNANWTDVSGWYYTVFSNGNTRAVLYKNGTTNASWGATGLSSAATASATANGVALSFTATDVTLFFLGDILMWKMLPQGGSVSQWTVPAWVVTNIAGSVVTCQPIVDALQFDTVANNGGGTSLLIVQNQWAPSGAALTATTNTSTSLTSVSPTTILKNGDWIQGSADVVANSRVVAGGGTATVTLNKAATGSHAGVNLFFGRLFTPTTTATW